MPSQSRSTKQWLESLSDTLKERAGGRAFMGKRSRGLLLIKGKICLAWGLLQWLSGKESTCDAGDAGFNPWIRKILWRRKWQPTPVYLPREFHGQRRLVGYSPCGHKEWRHDLGNEQQQQRNELKPLRDMKKFFSLFSMYL